ncbi:helix-turn-helix domain-containing protein [Streptacidiphilus cavernicola]|uniref:Helix-turn-helix domain-containing protein n=1 Tax=Streptacidiphilus cavernicola TaxID=3342716 RepID=A0ABV6VV75_9ACTN
MGGVYRERPSRAVPGAVLWSWQSAADAEAGTGRVLPDGCMDLVWTGGQLLVAGPDTAAQVVQRKPGECSVGLRFAPGTAAGLLGVAAWELRDRRVPLEELWSGRAGVVARDGVAAAVPAGADGESAAGSAAAMAAALEALVRARASGYGWERDPVGGGVLDGLRRGLGVAGISAELSLSERQLLRRCRDLFGYGPSTLGRVLRLERALAAARGGEAFAAVAVGAGYADQAHLAREVRALAGVPLTELLADG